MAEPLLQEMGYGSIIIENPFYGCRKPKDQFRSSLQHVSDLFVMGASLILESLVIFHWCEKQQFSPIISHGLSMGGHMASLGKVDIFIKNIAEFFHNVKKTTLFF